MKRTFAVLLLFTTISGMLLFKSCVMDRPSEADFNSFTQKFEMVKKGMTRQQVKGMLGETDFRYDDARGLSMDNLTQWVYIKYRKDSTPVVIFDYKTNMVEEVKYYDADDLCHFDNTLDNIACRIMW